MIYQSDRPGQTARLEDYLEAVKARKALVVAIVLAALALAAYVDSQRTERFTAAGTVLLGPTPVGSVDNRLEPPNLEREREVLLSDEVARAAADRLGTGRSGANLLRSVSAEFVPDSDVLRVEAENRDPEQAAAVANAFIASFVEQREANAVEQYQRLIESYDAQLAPLALQADELRAEIAALQAERQAVVTSNLEPVVRDAERARLDEQMALVRTQLDAAVVNARDIQRTRATAVSSLDARQTSAAVLRTAGVPSSPIGLGSSLIYVLGLLGGLALAMVAAFFAQRLDRTARSEDEVSVALDTEVLGSVPRYGRQRARSLVMLNPAKKLPVLRAKEAFRRMRTAVTFLESTEKVEVLLFTSAHPGEGKTATAANVAVALAQQGRSVAVVSADLRQPTMEGLFGVSNDVGLTDYLSGAVDEVVALTPAGFENLFVLPAGPRAPNPAELLASPRFRALVKRLRDEVDLTVIDTAPMLSTADALAAMEPVDGVVVVVDSSRTESLELSRLRSEISRAGGRILGAVLNKEKVPRKLLSRGRDRYAYYDLGG